MGVLLPVVMTLATLSSLSGRVVAGQEIGVLHIKAFLVNADGKPVPVPRHALLISDNPPSSTPRRILTALDGTVDVRLRPGNYTVESDKPFAFDGKGYQWTQIVDVPAGRDALLELTASNAELVPLTAEVAVPAPPRDPGSSSLLAQWQASVIELWTPTTHAAGFVVDGKGLIVTNQQAVGGATAVEAQVTPTVKVTGSVVVTDAERDAAIIWIDPAAAPLKPVPLGCGRTDDAPADRKVITIGSTRRQLKRMTSGSMSGRAAHLIPSDLTIGPDSAGGPVFAVGGPLVGLTTRLKEEADGDARVVPVADVCALLASSEPKLKTATAPPASLLPVEPSRGFPAGAL